MVYLTGTFFVLFQPSLIKTRKQVYIFGHPCHWPSGVLDQRTPLLGCWHADTSSQDSSNLFFSGGSKVQKFCSVLDLELPSTSTLCHHASPCIFYPVVGVPSTTAYAYRFFGLCALGGHRRMGLRSLVHSLGLQLDWLTDWLTGVLLCSRNNFVPKFAFSSASIFR